MKLLIAGGPRTGKTTLARTLGQRHGVMVRSTDDLIGVKEWSEASTEVAGWLGTEGSWIVEGVAVGRALRKWFAANPKGRPADVLYWSTAAKAPLTKGQQTMTKGCVTVFAEIHGEILRRGMRVETF